MAGIKRYNRLTFLVIDIMQRLIDLGRKILQNESICDRCLGRAFARLGTGLSNEERGRALRTVCVMSAGDKISRPQSCPICADYFEQVESWAESCLDLAKNIEFERYLMGSKPPESVSRAEEAFWLRYDIPEGQREPFKQEFNRLVGRRFGQLRSLDGNRCDVDFHEPQVVFFIDLIESKLDFQSHSLFIYGRYKKYVRDIPQTEWPCRKCKGQGCSNCNNTGKQYLESVGELMAAPVMRAAGSPAHSLHGAGREDIDARMLGTGRPFVLEIKEPRIRRLDLMALKDEINRQSSGKVEVGELKFVKRAVVEEIKVSKAEKSYQARVSFESAITESALNQALLKLIGPVSQQTPHRVLHRRADLTRSRRLFSATSELITVDEALIWLKCDGGLYVKELISGDGGRCTPSLSELLGVGAKVMELDVLDVRGNFPDSL